MANKKARKKASETSPRAMTQSAVFQHIASETDLPKTEVKLVLQALGKLIQSELNPRRRAAPGKIIIPGICRIVAKKKPARKARKGINPFTKEPCVFKARPKTTVVKIIPVKALKDAVAG